MRPGQIVTLRDECWTVTHTESFERCTVLTLEGRGPENAGRVFHAITPFECISAPATTRPLRRRRRSVLRCALSAIAQERPARGLWTAAAATIDLLAYQLEPALAVLHGATRVLLADAVGLGKTVQASLILAELRARGLVDRALVLCPAGLRESWAHELRNRFGVDATVLDQSTIAMNRQALPAGVNPWAVPLVVVASIDLVKRPEVLAAVEEVPFDLVIVDEAHHLTPASDRGHAVDRLGSRVPWLVLVSATPHSGDRAAFEYLTAVGALGDRLVIFRRGRHDIGLPVDRRSRLISVRPTSDEARLLQATDDYARAIWHGRGRSDRGVQLVAITLARRAASSAAALERTLSRRRALLSGTSPLTPLQGSLTWEEVEAEDGDELDERLACPGLLDEAAERRHLEALIDLARQTSAHSSKLSRLGRLLDRAGESAVVFTEYRDTLEAASQQLISRFRLGSIHGGVPAPMRQEIVRQFERGDVEVLLATDTAGEGLNLHRRCRLVINLELPWNPCRIEQRVGRVDRLGQRRRVHAVHLVHKGTVEDRVWSHLEQRRLRAEQALHDYGAVAADDIAQAVFDGIALPSSRGEDITSTRIDAAADELVRVTAERRARLQVTAGFSRPVFAPHRGGRYRGGRAVALYEYARQGSTGNLVERRVGALAVALRHLDADGWRQVATAMAAMTSDACLEPPPSWQAATDRIAAARIRLASPPRTYQASLFDRRAQQAAGARRDIAARIDAALHRRAASLSSVEGQPIHARLVAFWPLGREP